MVFPYLQHGSWAHRPVVSLALLYLLASLLNRLRPFVLSPSTHLYSADPGEHDVRFALESAALEFRQEHDLMEDPLAWRYRPSSPRRCGPTGRPGTPGPS